MGDVSMGIMGSLLGLVAIAIWLAFCWWVIARLASMDAALISKVIWAVAILAFPIAGLIVFLLLADRTPQMERELGIRRF
jgi:hypothetical protein